MDALINKDLLKLIFERVKIVPEFVSSKIGMSLNKLENVLDLTSDYYPTIQQAKDIAKLLNIPFAGLYMDIKDFPFTKIPRIKNRRSTLGAYTEDESAINIAIHNLCLGRDSYIRALDETEFSPNCFKKQAITDTSIADWAEFIRYEFKIDKVFQKDCDSSRKFYLYLRNCLEDQGLYIQGFSGVDVSLLRGVAIYEEKLPIIGVNDKDAPSAKCFTLIHELVHILKRESSSCNEMYDSNSTSKEEVFCNAVAGEVLVPKDDLTEVLDHDFRHSVVLDFRGITCISNMFSISREVIVRRLYDIGYFSIDDYHKWIAILKEKYEQAKLKNKSVFINPVFKKFDSLSPSYSSCLLYGYINDVYSRLDVAHYLNIKLDLVDKYFVEVKKNGTERVI